MVVKYELTLLTTRFGKVRTFNQFVHWRFGKVRTFNSLCSSSGLLSKWILSWLLDISRMQILLFFYPMRSSRYLYITCSSGISVAYMGQWARDRSQWSTPIFPIQWSDTITLQLSIEYNLSDLECAWPCFSILLTEAIKELTHKLLPAHRFFSLSDSILSALAPFYQCQTHPPRKSWIRTHPCYGCVRHWLRKWLFNFKLLLGL